MVGILNKYQNSLLNILLKTVFRECPIMATLKKKNIKIVATIDTRDIWHFAKNHYIKAQIKIYLSGNIFDGGPLFHLTYLERGRGRI